MDKSNNTNSVGFRLFLCTVILVAAVAGFIVLKNMKKPPAQTAEVERPLMVEGVEVKYSDFPVRISGFGEVRSRSVISISAEVSGKVKAIHSRLEVGEIVEKGEVLIALDDRDQRLEYATAEARLKILQRDHELAVKEYERLKSLYESSKTGSLSSVEKAEKGVNAIADRISQVELARESAKLRLERSVIRAPFTCRITEVMVEPYEYVTPGKKLMTVTDDADLEIVVSLDSRDVINWLEFDPENGAASSSWFAPLVNRECVVEWTEDNTVQAKGKVDRIVRFDPKSRTILVAIRLEDYPDKVVPVVDGMFCKATIPGLMFEKVVVLPRHAVSFENTIYVAVDNRLQTRPVKVGRLEQEQAVVTGGVSPGEIVVTTRLEQPLENTLLSVNLQDAAGK